MSKDRHFQEIEDIALGASASRRGGGGDPYIGKLHGHRRREGMRRGGAHRHRRGARRRRSSCPSHAWARPRFSPRRAWAPTSSPSCIDMVVALLRQANLRHHAHRGWRRELHAAHCGGGAPGPAHGGCGRHGPRLPRAADGHLHHRRRARATPMALIDEKGNSGIFETITNKWTEEHGPRRCTMTMRRHA